MKRYSLGTFITVNDDLLYYYDTNSNRIIRVKKEYKKFLEEYVYYGEITEENSEIADKWREWMRRLIIKGILRPNPIEKIQHPLYDIVGSNIENDIHSLLLQVTQNCNLLCRYCNYAAHGEFDRTHADVHMSEEIAKKSIDYVYNHAKNIDKVNISFYGGEPCENFELISKCVEYIDSCYKGCARYNMTTNFTIVNERMMDLFIKNEFEIMVSIDGPRNITNSMRRYNKNGEGVYDTIIKNLNKLKEKDEKYYSKHISFNAVIDPKYDIDQIADYFQSNELFAGNNVNFSLIDDSKNDYLVQYTDEYVLSYESRRFDSCVKKLFGDEFEDLLNIEKVTENTFFEAINQHKCLSKVFHHAGPCLAGSTRLFVDTLGNFYPCEKAAGLSKSLKIGDVNEGIDTEIVKKCLNIGSLSEKQCQNCWACRLCSICAVQCDDINMSELSGAKKEMYCVAQKEQIMKKLKNYILISECNDIVSKTQKYSDGS